MKITDVEAIILRQPEIQDIADASQVDLLIRISTDEGVVGIGEVDSAPEAVKALVEASRSHAVAIGLRELLIGEDPLQIEHLWDKMYRRLIYVGRRGIGIHAISGIDIALWDIKGKVLGKPIHELIGKPLRTKIPAYASMLMPESPEQVRQVVTRAWEANFRAVKLGWGPLGSDPDRDIELVKAACEVAEGRQIMIDAGLGYGRDSKTAIRVARSLEELGVFWLEEPFLPDEYEAYAELADTVGLRVAAGEEEATVWDFRELIERGHVDVVQPDVERCGGITEILRIAALARTRGVQTVPHAWKSGIITATTLHINAVLPDAIYQEYCVSETPINKNLIRQSLPVDSEGFVTVPDGPGLGIELNPDIVEEFRVDR